MSHLEHLVATEPRPVLIFNGDQYVHVETVARVVSDALREGDDNARESMIEEIQKYQEKSWEPLTIGLGIFIVAVIFFFHLYSRDSREHKERMQQQARMTEMTVASLNGKTVTEARIGNDNSLVIVASGSTFVIRPSKLSGILVEGGDAPR